MAETDETDDETDKTDETDETKPIKRKKSPLRDKTDKTDETDRWFARRSSHRQEDILAKGSRNEIRAFTKCSVGLSILKACGLPPPPSPLPSPLLPSSRPLPSPPRKGGVGTTTRFGGAMQNPFQAPIGARATRELS